MILSVATNFDDELIRRIAKYNVREIYGKLTSDFIGGGRSSYMLSPVSKKRVEEHVIVAGEYGIGFNYLLNASCLSNFETTRSGQKKIRQTLDWISNIGVSSTTVSNHFLLKIIKKNYPHLKVRISVFCQVDHVDKAIFWEDKGADVICLDSLTVNRDFAALKSIRQAVNCQLELLTNGNCHKSCSLNVTHMNLLSHSSQTHDKNSGFVIDHCMLDCTKRKLESPVGYIKSDWIRPEDIKIYEELGYNYFKIIERNLPTSIMVQRVKAYSERKYSGNLLDLIQPYGHKLDKKNKNHYKKNIWWFLKYFIRPGSIKLSKLLTMKKLSEKRGMLTSLESDNPIFVDNKKLNGFLETLLKNNCRYRDCSKCQHCDRVADDVVSINGEFRKACLKLYETIENDMVSGDMW